MHFRDHLKHDVYLPAYFLSSATVKILRNGDFSVSPFEYDERGSIQKAGYRLSFIVLDFFNSTCLPYTLLVSWFQVRIPRIA